MILCENIMTTSLNDIRITLFGMLETHLNLIEVNNHEYIRLLGLYSSQYQYGSELYVHCIALTRKYKKSKDIEMANMAIDRRDMLEQYLKTVKFNYDALSRKITVVTNEENI